MAAASKSSDAQLTKGPAKSELDPVRVRSLGHARPLTPHFVTTILHFVKIPFSGSCMHLKLRSMKFDFQRFYQAVNAKREERAASWRQVAREIGIGKSTLARMSQNKRPDADGLAALSFWAELNPADFVVLEQPMVSAVLDSAGANAA